MAVRPGYSHADRPRFRRARPARTRSSRRRPRARRRRGYSASSAPCRSRGLTSGRADAKIVCKDALQHETSSEATGMTAEAAYEIDHQESLARIGSSAEAPSAGAPTSRRTGHRHDAGQAGGRERRGREVSSLAVGGRRVDRGGVGSGTRRERWWRARHQQTSWSPVRFLDSAEARRDDVSVQRELLRLQQVVLERGSLRRPRGPSSGWKRPRRATTCLT